MPGEFSGRILHVDLTTGALDVEHPPESFYRTYLGGSAMGLYYVLQGMKAGTDGLHPDNILTVMDSLLTGAPIAGQSRVTINARSPLTDGIGDSQGGGFFPAELRFAGFDGDRDPRTLSWAGLPLDPRRRGRAAGGRSPVGPDDRRGRRPAQAPSSATTRSRSPRSGPAGEKLVRLAAIMNMANRANGRTGMGAVMGSKNLKAIVVRGTSKKLPLADAAAPQRARPVGHRRDPE